MARNVAASGLLHLKPAIAGDYILHQNPTELNTFYLSVNDGGRAAQYKVF